MASKRLVRLFRLLSGTAANAGDEIYVLEGRVERFVHFWVLVARQFIHHRCLVRASALSYATLIALIPLLAVALSLTSSLLKTQGEEQFQRAIEKFVATITPPATLGTNVVQVSADFHSAAQTNAPDTATEGAGAAPAAGSPPSEPSERMVTVTAQKEIARQIWGFVQKTQGAALGATGVVVLLFVSISLLGRIEETFNDIWGVARGRNLLTQVQLYSTTILLGPLLLLAAFSLAGSGQFQSVKAWVSDTPVIGKLVFQFCPLLVLWLLFTFMYQLLPNTKVHFSAALAGGAVAGSLWYLNNIFGFIYISSVAKNINFYGSLGLVPVFMVGLYFSWVFLLLGAQIAYAFQNRAAYLQDRLAENVNQRGREFVALRLMTRLGQRFFSGARPPTVNELSKELGIPSRLTHSILRVLGHNGLVMEVAGAESAYAPSRPLDTISAHDIVFAMRNGTAQGQSLPTDVAPELTEIYGEFAAIEQAERQAASSISLLALASRGAVQAELPPPPSIPVPEFSAAPPETLPLPIDKPVLPLEKIDLSPAPPEFPAPPPKARREAFRPEETTDFPL